MQGNLDEADLSEITLWTGNCLFFCAVRLTCKKKRLSTSNVRLEGQGGGAVTWAMMKGGHPVRH